MSYIDKTKLLTDVNNGIKAGNFEEGYEQYQNINNMDDIIEAIEWADEADVIERFKVNKAIEDINTEMSYGSARFMQETMYHKGLKRALEILKRNIGE